eukprot:2672562-Pleurochrysis_carterae.AAC.1
MHTPTTPLSALSLMLCNGASIDKAGKAPQPVSHRVTNRRQRQHHVRVHAAALCEPRPERHARTRALGHPLLLSDVTQLAQDRFGLIRREERGHLARVQDGVDVLQEGLALDLAVAQQEGHLLAVAAGGCQQLLQVVAPLCQAVGLAHLQSEGDAALDVRGQTREALPARAADADEQRVAERLRKHARDPAHVVKRVLEEHQTHRRRRECVVVGEIPFNRRT